MLYVDITGFISHVLFALFLAIILSIKSQNLIFKIIRVPPNRGLTYFFADEKSIFTTVSVYGYASRFRISIGSKLFDYFQG